MDVFLLTPRRSPNSALPLHTQKQCTARGSSWGLPSLSLTTRRLLDPPLGRVVALLSSLTPVPPFGPISLEWKIVENVKLEGKISRHTCNLISPVRSERSKFQGLMGKLNFQTGDALYCYRGKSFPAQLYSKTYDWIFQRVQSRVVIAMHRI